MEIKAENQERVLRAERRREERWEAWCLGKRLLSDGWASANPRLPWASLPHLLNE